MYYLYLVKNEPRFCTEIGGYRSYALCCYLRGPFSKRLIASVSDVSTDEQFVQALADLCTAGQLHPDHLLDVILDAI